MIGFSPMLAELGPEAPTKASGLFFKDSLLIIAIAAAIFLGLLVWVAVVRGPKQQGRSRRIYKEDEDGHDSSHHHHGRRRKKKKTRRREHRMRNPTLAQTGGLPPPRPEGEVADGPML